jgi:hypothetical protein
MARLAELERKSLAKKFKDQQPRHNPVKNVKNAKNKRSLNSSGPGVRPPTKAEIAALAYSIWEREGCPEGCDMEHWQKAELEIRQRSNTQAPPPSSRV